jgi:peroxiredoxin
MSLPGYLAPDLDVGEWLNTQRPLQLADFRGRVVVLEAFQMLCPGCVQHSVPQAQRVARLFRPSDVQVIGLHTVFEHHEAQGSRAALAAFLHENRVEFPVGIDRQSGRLPATMAAYEMQGTPTIVLIDAQGRRRAQHFGPVDDLQLGTEIGRLLQERSEA